MIGIIPLAGIRGTKSSAATTTPAAWPVTAFFWLPAVSNVTDKARNVKARAEGPGNVGIEPSPPCKGGTSRPDKMNDKIDEGLKGMALTGPMGFPWNLPWPSARAVILRAFCPSIAGASRQKSRCVRARGRQVFVGQVLGRRAFSRYAFSAPFPVLVRALCRRISPPQSKSPGSSGSPVQNSRARGPLLWRRATRPWSREIHH